MVPDIEVDILGLAVYEYFGALLELNFRTVIEFQNRVGLRSGAFTYGGIVLRYITAVITGQILIFIYIVLNRSGRGGCLLVVSVRSKNGSCGGKAQPYRKYGHYNSQKPGPFNFSHVQVTPFLHLVRRFKCQHLYTVI